MGAPAVGVQVVCSSPPASPATTRKPLPQASCSGTGASRVTRQDRRRRASDFQQWVYGGTGRRIQCAPCRAPDGSEGTHARRNSVCAGNGFRRADRRSAAQLTRIACVARTVLCAELRKITTNPDRKTRISLRYGAFVFLHCCCCCICCAGGGAAGFGCSCAFSTSTDQSAGTGSP